ncbi:MAG TPA: glycosyltransferase, partial [Chryseosolibacter sp.]|nr:glycosyltransferase [Chryseosolibacter sp.]
MRKVLYVIDSLQVGGAERSIFEISSGLERYTPVVCHIYLKDALKAAFIAAGVRVISLGVKGPYDFFRAGRKLLRVLKTERPDLVVGTLLRTELISRITCKLAGIPYVGTFVGNPYSSHLWTTLSPSLRLKKLFFKRLNIATAGLCSGFIANSMAIRAANCEVLRVPETKVHVIYRGRDARFFSFQTHRFSPEKTRILAVGRLLRGKGYEELVRAFALFVRQHRQATLTIAGEGPYKTELENLIGELSLQGRVDMRGSVSDIPSLMHAHDLLA